MPLKLQYNKVETKRKQESPEDFLRGLPLPDREFSLSLEVVVVKSFRVCTCCIDHHGGPNDAIIAITTDAPFPVLVYIFSEHQHY